MSSQIQFEYKYLVYRNIALVKLITLPCALFTDHFVQVEKIAKKSSYCYNTAFAFDLEEIVILL